MEQINESHIHGHFQEGEKFVLMELWQDNTALHRHDFLEMAYVVSGAGRHTLNGETTTVSQGDYFIIDYGAYHKYQTIGNAPFEIINILFLPAFIDKTMGRCRSFRDLLHSCQILFSYHSLNSVPTNVRFSDTDGSIFMLIQRMRRELSEKGPGYLELIRCYLLEIILLSMRRIHSNQKSPPADHQVRYLMRYAEENYMHPMTLTELSRRLNFSLPYMSRRFRESVGTSFSDFLQRKRIEKSCALLASTDKKFSDIAHLAGYTDVKFFNEVFKKHTGMTPREFKRLHAAG